MCTLSSSPPDVHTPHTPHTCTPHTVRLSDGRTLRATDLLAVSSLLGCWDQPRKLHVCPGRYGIVVGSRVRGRSRDARPGVSSSLPVTCYLLFTSNTARLVLGANLHFPKYFEKYARLAREEKYPEIYRTRDRILLFVSALYGFRVLH